MAVCLSDLPPLGNILDSFQLVEITDSKDIEDIRESIQLIIENFMEDNILIQRCKDFELQLYVHIYAVLENIELISDINVEELISEGIYLYTNLISVPRSIDDPTKISPSNHGAIAKRIKLPLDKVILTLDKHGNTSAASIPLALDTGVRDGRIKKGDTLLFEGIGGGFSWGSILLEY